MRWFSLLCSMLREALATRATLLAENLALRQQLAALRLTAPRPRLSWRDRLFWVFLCHWCASWREWLVIVQPETVIRWHCAGFRLFGRWKSRGRRPGRPTVPRAVIALLKRMARENPTWGAPRVRSELHLLGHDIAESTVAKYLPKGRKPPSQTWKTFLTNHVGCLASIDFFVVPTATFQVLYGFVVLCHERRRVVHCNVTQEPCAAWVVGQLREAFPYDTAPRFLIRDRDGIYGSEVPRWLRIAGIEEVVTAPRSPWQNPYVERLIGTLRRDLLDRVIVLNEKHLRRLLGSYFGYYHDTRCHRALDGDARNPREVEPPERGAVVAVPMVGGLHRRYRRAA